MALPSPWTDSKSEVHKAKLQSCLQELMFHNSCIFNAPF